MAQGVIELKGAKGIDHVMEHNIQYFLDRFYISRISIRFGRFGRYLLLTPKKRNALEISQFIVARSVQIHSLNVPDVLSIL